MSYGFYLTPNKHPVEQILIFFISYLVNYVTDYQILTKCKYVDISIMIQFLSKGILSKSTGQREIEELSGECISMLDVFLLNQ